jgi:alpha-galactosidase
MQRYERIDGGGITFAIALAPADAPRLLHFGPRLAADADLAAIDLVQTPGPRESTPDAPVPPSLFPPAGLGWFGEPAIDGVHDEGDGALAWSTSSVRRDDQRLSITLRDERCGLRVELGFSLDADTGVLATSARVQNEAEHPFRLGTIVSACLPLPAWASEIQVFDGDWAREGRPYRTPAPQGVWCRTNRTGRTGFSGATVLALEPTASDTEGRCIALHLAWSGDHRLAVETLSDGRRQALAGQHLAAGEIILEHGASFETPVAYACMSTTGFNGLSDAFHPFVRNTILPPRSSSTRKVHFNSWEAAYFSFDEASLKSLATAAATIGVERFVLDDGWFSGRRDDTTSLGDWRVDSDRFPEGLGPLIEHVHGQGMDFGLWVEPEMVSPVSDFYRDHPDWCVHAPGAARPTMRHQLWLDLSREEVRDHLFTQLDTLLATHAIAYLKWDCNRFMFPATSRGVPAGGQIVRGAYALMDRLRARHPSVEIESCASGGARIDLEVLKRTTRVWPSDTTDPIERLRIQKWASLMLPLDVIGAHIGPSPNPITGRETSLDFRARVALFGHLGVEMDPRRLDASERDELATHIACYKQHRALLHSGRHLRWTTDDGADIRAVVSAAGDEALVLACRIEVAAHAIAAPVRFHGLDRNARYRLTLPEPWPRPAQRRLADQAVWKSGKELSGALLADQGVALPLADPQTAWLIHIERR